MTTQDEKYIKNLEKEVERLQHANNVVREFVDYIAKDSNPNEDMIKRICVSLISKDMILNWLDNNEFWNFDSKLSDNNFERKIYVSNTKSNAKRITVITRIVTDKNSENTNAQMTTSVFEAFNEVLANAESSGIGKIRVITSIILGK